MKTNQFHLAILFLMTACSSAPQSGVDRAGEEVILSRIDHLGSRPDWLKEETPLRIDRATIYSLGETTIPLGDSLSAAYRISESNAKAELSSAITQKLTYFFQDVAEGTSGASQAHYIGESVSKLSSSDMRLSHRYWEEISQMNETGQQKITIRVFALVEMPEEKFKAKILEIAREAEGKQTLSAEFAAKVDREFDKMLNGDAQKNSEIRKPTSLESVQAQQ